MSVPNRVWIATAPTGVWSSGPTVTYTEENAADYRKIGWSVDGPYVLEGGEPCSARLYHGPGHQSRTSCRLLGEHEVHEAVYGGDQQVARWRDGSYTDLLREKSIDFDPGSYPEDMAMTGFFDEPPEEPE